MQAVTKTPPVLAARNNERLRPPREADFFGRMVCFHPRYRLGIQHDFEEPADFLRALVEKTLEEKEIVDYLLSGRCNGLELQYSLVAEAWDLIACADASGNWYVVDSFPAVQEYVTDIADTALAVMDIGELYELAQRENAILPVYLPASSSPFLKTSLNADAWSAGQIGWIYADKRAVNRKYRGTRTQVDRLIKADAVLQGIVERHANPRHKRKGKGAAV